MEEYGLDERLSSGGFAKMVAPPDFKHYRLTIPKNQL
jgi:hypothetical protein